MFGAGDDVVLGFFGEDVEEGAVAGYADDEVAVVFGVGLGVQEGVAADDVELDVVAVEAVKEGAQEGQELLAVFFFFQHLGGDLLV